MFEFPEEPVDGFTVDYWTTHIGVRLYYATHKRAVYYVNTEYQDTPNARPDRVGAPLINQWMGYDVEACGDLRAIGRSNGWSRLGKLLNEDLERRTAFKTEKDALLHIRDYYLGRSRQLAKDALDNADILGEVLDRLDRMS